MRVRRKLATFARDPAGSIAAVRKRRRRARRTARIERARQALAEAGALALLEEFSARRPDGGFEPQYDDLWFLYRTVRWRRPLNVLEFGSGCSTVVLAAALAANGEGHVWSIDADEHWRSATAAGMPAQVDAFVTVTYSPVVGEQRADDTVGVYHTDVPDVPVDFLYLDGPGRVELDISGDRAGTDPLRLEERFRPGFVMVVDGRDRTAAYLRSNLRRRYRYQHQPAGDRHVFELEPARRRTGAEWKAAES